MLSYHVIIPCYHTSRSPNRSTGGRYGVDPKVAFNKTSAPFCEFRTDSCGLFTYIHGTCQAYEKKINRIPVYDLYNDHKAVLFASRPPDVASVNIVFLFGSQRSYLFILLYETVTSRYGSFHSHRNTICIIINPDISICMTRKTGRRIT